MKVKLLFGLKTLFTFFALIICFRALKDNDYLFAAILIFIVAFVNLPKSRAKKKLLHMTLLCCVITTFIQSLLLFSHYKKSQKLSLKDTRLTVHEKVGLPANNMKYGESLDTWFIPFWLGGLKTTVSYTKSCHRINHEQAPQACNVKSINQNFHTLKENHWFFFKKIRNQIL